MSISEALGHAIKDGMDRYAYSLLWLVQNGVYDGNAKIDTVDFSKVNHVEVARLKETGILEFSDIQLYSMPIEPRLFMLVFAKCEADARGLFLTNQNRLPSRIDNMTTKMDISFYFDDVGHKTLRELKDETMDFPSIAVIYDKREKSYEQVAYEYYLKFGLTFKDDDIDLSGMEG